MLSALCASPARPTDLCDEVDATRTTIQRILAGFRERAWVEKRDGDYRPTVTGRRVHDRYQDLLAEVDRARQFGPLATALGPLAEDMPEAVLEDAEITVGSEQNPLAAVSRFTEWFREAEGPIRAVSPIVAQSFNDAAAELLADGTQIEFVIDGGVLERSASDFETELEEGLEHELIDIYVHQEPLSVGLVVDETRCCLAAYDDRNNLRALVESTDEAVREWVETQYRQRFERARPLESVLAEQ